MTDADKITLLTESAKAARAIAERLQESCEAPGAPEQSGFKQLIATLDSAIAVVVSP